MINVGYKSNVTMQEYDSLGYAPDGLVSMFDAEWNTMSENGVKKHIGQTIVWSDIGQEKLIGDLKTASNAAFNFGYDKLDLTKAANPSATDYARIATSSFNPVMPEQYTFELCIRNFTSNGVDPTFFAGIWGSSGVRPSLYVYQNRVMVIWQSSQNYKTVYFESNLSWNRVHTISASYASSGSSLFLDGMKIADGAGKSSGTSNGVFRINSNNTNNTAQEGCYHCFRMYSRILPEADVLHNWENDTRRFES